MEFFREEEEGLETAGDMCHTLLPDWWRDCSSGFGRMMRVGF